MLEKQNRKPKTRRLANAMVTGKMLNVVTWNAPVAEDYYGFVWGMDEGLPPISGMELLEARRYNELKRVESSKFASKMPRILHVFFGNPAFLTNVLSKNVPGTWGLLSKHERKGTGRVPLKDSGISDFCQIHLHVTKIPSCRRPNFQMDGISKYPTCYSWGRKRIARYRDGFW